MPKRSHTTSTNMSTDLNGPPVKVQKTERSHEENQERAYIAASRRADRSLEARVQSAKMASDIHRKRTGRGLKVSEEIVLKEEMYEEMEDDLPRPYRYLTAHLQTGSPELNHRVSAYVASQTALATMAKYNEINKMFNEAFPRAASYSHQMRDSIYMGPFVNNRLSTPSLPGPLPSTAGRNSSVSAQSQSSIADKVMPDTSSGHTPTTISAPTPDLSPSITSPGATESAGTPYQASYPPSPNLPLDSHYTQPSSSFTSELPQEIKMMANIDMNDPMAIHLLGDDASSFPIFNQYGGSAAYLPNLDPSMLDSPDCSKLTMSNDDRQALSPSIKAPSECNGEFPADNIGQFAASNSAGAGLEGWESLVDFDTEQ
ncbi:hypothetical protein F4777DRAFT_571823 [Nemania sp. FL0916]|nr:hypothetical protein F4777DRAFT_571823 [Nemania sp. FL0916]